MPNSEKSVPKARRVARPVAAAGASVAAAMVAAGAAAPSAAVEPAVSPAGQRHIHEGLAGPAIKRLLYRWTRTRPSLADSSTAGDSTTTYSIPASIVMCESGGNWRAVNPSTGAGGAYQILPSTWTTYGGGGLPQNASPAEQSAIAAKIYASVGRSAWSC